MTDDRIGRQDCYICGGGHPAVLERHHIVPKRLGGGDEPPNRADLCPTCHRAVEKLYDSRFYDELGVTPTRLVSFAEYCRIRDQWTDIAWIKKMDDPQELRKLAVDEVDGKGRKPVIGAINRRLMELKAEA